MAAAGPRGRDGPSPREFATVRHFMMADLGLSGLPLLVYARIFGCRSAASTAPSATCSTRASSRSAACTPRRAGMPPSDTASCARGCRPERWQPLTIRQGSRRERVTK